MTLNYPRVSQKCKDSFIVWHHFDQNCSLKFCNTQVIIVSQMPGSIRMIWGFYAKQKTHNQPQRTKETRLKDTEERQLVFLWQPRMKCFTMNLNRLWLYRYRQETYSNEQITGVFSKGKYLQWIHSRNDEVQCSFLRNESWEN